MIPKWSPRGAFGSTLGTENDPKAYKIFVLGTSILHTDFGGPPGSHCGQNRLRIICQKQYLDCAGASGSHVDHSTKKFPSDHIFKGFWCRIGCQIEPLGTLWARDGTFFAAGFGVVVRAMRTIKPQPGITSRQRAKSI